MLSLVSVTWVCVSKAEGLTQTTNICVFKNYRKKFLKCNAAKKNMRNQNNF